jgi:hypothetical protein
VTFPESLASAADPGKRCETFRQSGRAVVLNSTPPRLHYVWPMQVGQTWEQTMLEERPVARQANERVDTVMVEVEETVTVPAGTFKTIKWPVATRRLAPFDTKRGIRWNSSKW